MTVQPVAPHFLNRALPCRRTNVAIIAHFEGIVNPPFLLFQDTIDTDPFYVLGTA